MAILGLVDSSNHREIPDADAVYTKKTRIEMIANTLLETPLAGAIEYDGKRFYGTASSTRRVMSLASDTKVTTTTVANTLTETTIYTAPLGASDAVAGKIYRIPFFGVVSSSSTSEELTIRFKIDGITITTVVAIPKNLADASFSGHLVLIIRTIGASGTLAAHACYSVDSVPQESPPILTSIDTTTASTLTITVQWSAADAENTLSLYGAYLEDMN